MCCSHYRGGGEEMIVGHYPYLLRRTDHRLPRSYALDEGRVRRKHNYPHLHHYCGGLSVDNYIYMEESPLTADR